MEKLKQLKHKKVLMVMMAVAMMAVMAVPTFAAEGDTAADLSTFITTITGALSDFTTTNLATILVAALGLTCGLAIAWFAYRFIKAKVAGALKRGKI